MKDEAKQREEHYNRFLMFCENGDVGMVKKLVEENNLNIDYVSNKRTQSASTSFESSLFVHATSISISNAKEKITALALATKAGNQEIVTFLLKKGASVDKKSRLNPYGSNLTPLFIAVSNGHESIAILLLEAGADPNYMIKYFTGGDELCKTIIHRALLKNLSNNFFEMMITCGVDLTVPSHIPRSVDSIVLRTILNVFLITLTCGVSTRFIKSIDLNNESITPIALAERQNRNLLVKMFTSNDQTSEVTALTPLV